MQKVYKGSIIKKFLSLFLLFFSFVAVATATDIKYTSFIDNQLELVHQMNDNNATEKGIEKLIKKQEILYEQALDHLMSNKKHYINNIKLYNSEIFALKKIIAINKRAGNTYAVMRDEVQVKSYNVLRSQNLMLKNVLSALDSDTIEEFESKLNSITVKNQTDIQKNYTVDYENTLNIVSDSSTLAQAKKNIEEFRALKDINVDMVNNIYKLEYKMYRLNKYTKYHVIDVILYVNNFAIVNSLDKILVSYNLTVMKILFILFLFILVYFLRKLTYLVLGVYAAKLDHDNLYTKQIFEHTHKQIDAVMIVININLVAYVYNDFSSIEFVSRFFDVIYGFFFTLIIYKIVNIVAQIKLRNITSDTKHVRNELINVGLKILNFIIWTIGALIMMYFAGVNLTAVIGGLGIGGFAVAFAAKDTISNFFGTLSILFSDVFSQGDWIVVDGNEGVVVEIGLRVTTIRTFDNSLIAIPNGVFASSNVQNWDRRTLGRRIKMSIGVKYDSKADDINNALKDIREMLNNHPGISTVNTKYEYNPMKIAKLVSKDDLEGVKKTLLVYLDEFGPSSMDILIYCFSKSVDWEEWLQTKEDVMLKIMAILEKNSLEFAFPSMSIYKHDETKEKDQIL